MIWKWGTETELLVNLHNTLSSSLFSSDEQSHCLSRRLAYKNQAFRNTSPLHCRHSTSVCWMNKEANKWMKGNKRNTFSYSQPRSAFLMLWHTCVFAGPDWSCQSNSSSQFLPWWLKMLRETGQVKSYLQAKFICKHVQSLLKGLYIKMATWRHPTYSLPPHFSLLLN